MFAASVVISRIRYLITFKLYLVCTLIFFSFNDTPTTEIYTLSLHDALPIYMEDKDRVAVQVGRLVDTGSAAGRRILSSRDRKSTRLNSSHVAISYAVFCLKKKKKDLVYNEK